MELREYWEIFKRRWWIPVLLMLLVGFLSILQLRPWEARPVSYSASMRMLVGVMPAAEQDLTAYDPRYYAWLTSEYLVDDFTEVVGSQLFAANVSDRLADQAIDVPVGVIQGSAATGKQHRIITLGFSGGDEAEVKAIADAAARELEENATGDVRQLGTDGAGVTLIDGPGVGVVGPSLSSRLDLPLRMALAFLVGLGLIFLLEYLDTSIRKREELDEIGLSVIGEIPKE